MKKQFVAAIVLLSFCFVVGCGSPAPPRLTSPANETWPLAGKEGCERLLPIESVQKIEPRYELIGDQFITPSNYQGFISLLDAGTFEAFLWAEAPLFCVWGVPQSDSVSYLFAAQLPPQREDELIERLRSADYRESSAEDARRFEGELTFGEDRGPISVEHRFVPGLWVFAMGDSILLSSEVDLRVDRAH